MPCPCLIADDPRKVRIHARDVKRNLARQRLGDCVQRITPPLQDLPEAPFGILRRRPISGSIHDLNDKIGARLRGRIEMARCSSEGPFL